MGLFAFSPQLIVKLDGISPYQEKMALSPEVCLVPATAAPSLTYQSVGLEPASQNQIA